MQINRLFEIVYVLLSKKIVTAKELSERFEVSARTIYRDVEILGSAGLPVYMSKGRGGGISLLDSFVLNKSVLSDAEQNEILTALQGLNVIPYPEVDQVISKLGAFFNKSGYNWIDVDFSAWGNHDQAKFTLLKTAIVHKRRVVFDYFSTFGEKTSRTIEPLQLWFKSRAWYLRGYCLAKKEVRVFKLVRMKELELTDDLFEREWEEQSDQASLMTESYSAVQLKLLIQPSAAYRVFEEFDEQNMVKNEDGSYTVTVSYPEGEWIYGYILSYGSSAEVLEPQYIRNRIIERLEETLQKYK